jgi:hypothetical protein
MPGLPLDERAVKRLGQQSAQPQAFRLAKEVCEYDLDVSAKLPENLPAGPAGWSQRFRIGYHGYPSETARAFRNRFENGNAFGTERQSVSRVLHIATRVNSAIRVLQGRAYFEFRVRRVGIFASLERSRNQRVHIQRSRGSTRRSSSAIVPFTRSPASSTSL